MKKWQIRSLGGPGSGHFGHASQPGRRGGSLPRSAAMSIRTGKDWEARQKAAKGGGKMTPEEKAQLDKLQGMFRNKAELNRAAEELSWARQDYKRAEKQYHQAYVKAMNNDRYKSEMEHYGKTLQQQRERVAKAEDARDVVKEAGKKFRNAKAPGFGTWERVATEKAVAGGYAKYQVPGRPEFGEVTRYHFGGWSMQRVAANSFVEYGGGKYEWSGQGARESANRFMKKTFGI